VELLAEGVESIKLACSLVLLIPALGIALLGRRRVWLVPAWIATVAVVAWVRFSGWWTALPSGVWHVLAGAVLVAAAGLAWKRDELATDLAATVGVAFVATWTWVPCVGRGLGDVLNAARFEPWSQLAPTVVYFVGLFVPLIVLTALDVAWPRIGDVIDLPRVRDAGLVVITIVGGLVAVTLFDDLAGELARRSSF
jgi:hypothetical protein